jgi:RND family efflux transporter MFP subunit
VAFLSKVSPSQVSTLLAAWALAAAVGCVRSEVSEEIAPTGTPTISAEVGRVARGDLFEILTVRGTVAAAPNEDVKVGSLVAGRVISMRVAEGDRVAAGQVIAEIDPAPFEDERRQAVAGLEQARSTLENAKTSLDRAQNLFARGIAAGKEVDDAKAQQASAQAAVAQAAAALDAADRTVSLTRVTSPIPGYVVKQLIAVGEQVDGTAGQPLVQIANLEDVEIAASVPAEYLGRMRVGQKVEATTDAYASRRFAGQVVAIAPSVDPANNSALARVRVSNPGALLKVGMFAEARVQVGERRGVLVVPPSALSKENGEAAVYVLSGDIAERTVVKIGLETPNAVEIVSGVSEGQKVLTTSVHGLGERVRLARSL